MGQAESLSQKNVELPVPEEEIAKYQVKAPQFDPRSPLPGRSPIPNKSNAHHNENIHPMAINFD